MFPGEKTKSIETTRKLEILVVFLAAVFVMSLALTTSAQAFSLTGKVVAVDTHRKTLSVAGYFGPDYALSYSGGADRINTFALKRGAPVMRGSERRDFRDIKTGDWVIVDYYQEGGGINVADGIALTAPPIAYLGENAQVFSLPGRVVSIDRDARTLTVDASYYYGPNYGGEKVRVFALDRDIVVMAGNEPRDFRDIRVGDWVSVTFHQASSGFAVADGIVVTAPPAPYMEERAQTFSIPGKVVAIDRNSMTLTVDPSYCYGPNYGGTRGLRLFPLDRNTVVMMGSEPRDFRDIRIGDWVTVNYHEERNGIVITDGIAFTSPSVMTCPERQG